MQTVKAKGFAAMDPARVKQIASQGGKAAHQKSVAHQWTKLEAKADGAKGGQASASKKKSALQRTSLAGEQ